MSCIRVTKKNSKESRDRSIAIIKKVQKKLKNQYKFSYRLVGSATKNTIVEDDKGRYDLDYQLILTANSKNNINDANEVKQKFLQAFTDCKNSNEKVENSTSVITLRVSKSVKEFISEHERYSVDFAILKTIDDENFIVKRNGSNHYVWNELPSKNKDAFNKFNSFSQVEKLDLCDNYIIPRKCREKIKPNKDDRITSTIIFIEEVNNYYYNIKY